MNNEPVAWMNQTLDGERYLDWKENDVENAIPLYTHPAKTLTDEEINWLAKAYSTLDGQLNVPAFARAILRKAQE